MFALGAVINSEAVVAVEVEVVVVAVVVLVVVVRSDIILNSQYARIHQSVKHQKNSLTHTHTQTSSSIIKPPLPEVRSYRVPGIFKLVPPS